MGPAVTSEEESCEREKRLRSTASLSPHNTQSDTPATVMNADVSGLLQTSDCPSIAPNITPHSSSQLEESSVVVTSAVSTGQTTCHRMTFSIADNGLLLKQGDVNINLKDVKNFFRNNTHTMLPNGGTGCPGISDSSSVIQVTKCEETVPCGTVAPQFVSSKLVSSSQMENGKAPVGNVHHMIIIPKALGSGDAGRLPDQNNVDHNIDPLPLGVTDQKEPGMSVPCLASDENAANETLALIESVSKRQKRLRADASRLLKRLRRLQCREVNSAVKEKLGQAVASLHQLIGNRPAPATVSKNVNKDALGSRELTALSTAELVSYIQKLQSSQHQGCVSRHAAGHSGQVGDSAENSSKLSDDIRSCLRSTSGHLTSNMRHLKSAVDSDATESSSGGESCDESSPGSAEFSNVASSSAARQKLEWEWANDRSSIVARWTWIQAQVSDLEYRIRQQNDIYKQLRLSKGSVSLQDHACPTSHSDLTVEPNGRIKINRVNIAEDPNSEKNSSASDTRFVHSSGVVGALEGTNGKNRAYINVNKLHQRTADAGVAKPLPESGITNSDRGINSGEKLSKDMTVAPSLSTLPSSSAASQTSALQASTGPLAVALPSAVAIPGSTAIQSSSVPSTSASSSLSYDPSCRAARCMEVRGWRRRILLRTSGPYETNRKASRLTTVRCTCYPPVTPCALCGGRYNKVMKPGVQLLPSDRVALLDPSYHPVLSFSRDIPLPMQMAESLWKGPSKCEADGRHRMQNDHATKYCFRPVALRIKHKIGSRSHSNESQPEEDALDQESARGAHNLEKPVPSSSLRGRKMETIRKKPHLSLARKHLSKTSLRGSSLKGSRSQLIRRGYSSLRRQSSRSTFDINNVVIPSHVTSASRVNIIHYKEIATPKWREIPRYGDAATGNSRPVADVFPAAIKRPKLTDGDGEGCKKVHWINKEPEALAEPDGEENGEEIENLSDEAFAARHLRYEIYEKKQCLPTVGQQRRSRSNRSESDSYTLLNPQSPDAANLLDASTSMTSSTLSGGPSTSCLGYSDAEETGHHHGPEWTAVSRQHSEQKLTRNCSSVSWNASLPGPHNAEHLTDVTKCKPTPAWPPRIFPLGDAENEQLSVEHPRSSITQGGNTSHASGSPPVSMSTDSSVPSDEDPNDPEWTGAS